MASTEELRKALHDAATSLETISRLAGRKSYGNPPIETHMDTFMDVRLYAAARANVAREALSEPPRTNWLSESFAKFLREKKGYTDEQIAAECAANGLAAPGVALPDGGQRK